MDGIGRVSTGDKNSVTVSPAPDRKYLEPRKGFGDGDWVLVVGTSTPRYSTLTVGMEGLSHIRGCEEILAPAVFTNSASTQKKGNSSLWWGWINM